MVGAAINLDVRGFEWDEVNEAHLLRHGVRRQNVMDVYFGLPKYFVNFPEREGSHVMVVPSSSGVFFVISIRRTEADGIWRPITAWHVGERKARRLYGS